MAQDNFVLFKRGSQESLEDIWDDTALIEAYDEAVNTAKDKIAAKLALESSASTGNEESTKTETKSKEWKVGMFVRATYSEDGIIYEAVIEKMMKSNSSCIVKYLGYDNKEEVMLNDLLPSKGHISRKQQIDASREVASSDEMDCEVPMKSPNRTLAEPMSEMKWESVRPTSDVPSGTSNAFIPPPPPITSWPGKSSDEDSDSLYSMLMSWYMAGYHTGYYQGANQNKKGRVG